MRKESNFNRGVSYKAFDQYSSKMSKSSKTIKVCDTVIAKEEPKDVIRNFRWKLETEKRHQVKNKKI